MIGVAKQGFPICGGYAGVDATIFSFFPSDIVRLPFGSNFTKIGVSRHIDTSAFSAMARACDYLSRRHGSGQNVDIGSTPR